MEGNGAPRNDSALLPAWRGRDVVRATLVVVLVLLTFWLLLRFRGVIFVLFAAIVISTAMTPAVDFLFRRGLPRPAGVITIFAILMAMVVGFFVVLAPMMLDQAASISGDVTGGYHKVQVWLLSSPSMLVRRLALELPSRPPVPPVQDLQPSSPDQPQTPPAGESNQSAVDQQIIGQVTTLFDYLGLASRAIFNAVALLLLSFYWTLDGQRTIRGLLLLVPAKSREQTRTLVGEIQDRVGGYIRGVTILCLIVGSMALVAYSIIGLPYAVLLAVVAGIMEAVPVVGPGLGAIPAVLVAYTFGAPSQVLWVLVATGIIQTTENILLVPRVMGRSVGVHPIVTMLALITFGSLMGIAGAVLAVPIAAVLQHLLDTFVLKPGALDRQEPEGRDSLSALRLEIKELTGDIRKQVREKELASTLEADQLEDALEEIATELDGMLAGPPEEKPSTTSLPGSVPERVNR